MNDTYEVRLRCERSRPCCDDLDLVDLLPHNFGVVAANFLGAHLSVIERALVFVAVPMGAAEQPPATAHDARQADLLAAHGAAVLLLLVVFVLGLRNGTASSGRVFFPGSRALCCRGAWDAFHGVTLWKSLRRGSCTACCRCCWFRIFPLETQRAQTLGRRISVETAPVLARSVEISLHGLFFACPNFFVECTRANSSLRPVTATTAPSLEELLLIPPVVARCGCFQGIGAPSRSLRQKHTKQTDRVHGLISNGKRRINGSTKNSARIRVKCWLINLRRRNICKSKRRNVITFTRGHTWDVCSPVLVERAGSYRLTDKFDGEIL